MLACRRKGRSDAETVHGEHHDHIQTGLKAGGLDATGQASIVYAEGVVAPPRPVYGADAVRTAPQVCDNVLIFRLVVLFAGDACVHVCMYLCICGKRRFYYYDYAKR